MLINSFRKFSIEQVPRSENKKADALSKIASTSFAHLTKQVLVEVLKENLIEEQKILAVVEKEGDSWMTPLLEYLRDGTLPAEVKRARAIKIKSRQYVVISGVLYRKLFLEHWIRCVRPLQAEYVVREIHEGSYSMHSWPRSVVAKAIRSGYYWPPMHRDVERENRSLGEGIKARLGGENKNWVEEIGMPSLRCAKIDQAMNDEALLLNLDVLEEEREKAAIQEAKSKAKMERYYNAKVRDTIFKPRDFVYRNNEANHAMESGKLGPKWEGPYEIVEALEKGAYKIRNSSEDILPQTWNVKDLKRCYL
ncbi:reverse transcriptase domain-containing protein [Tanacetum coccineum]